jgi:hypothetical protein
MNVDERWIKTALLFFYALKDAFGKNKCAVCALAFFSTMFNDLQDFSHYR